MLLTADDEVVPPNGGLKVVVLTPEVKVLFPNGGCVDAVEIVLLVVEIDDDPLDVGRLKLL